MQTIPIWLWILLASLILFVVSVFRMGRITTRIAAGHSAEGADLDTYRVFGWFALVVVSGLTAAVAAIALARAGSRLL